MLDQTDSLSGSTPVSFASPDKNHPNSVQYIFMTSAIERPTAETETGDTEEDENFFTRLNDLFS